MRLRDKYTPSLVPCMRIIMLQSSGYPPLNYQRSHFDSVHKDISAADEPERAKYRERCEQCGFRLSSLSRPHSTKRRIQAPHEGRKVTAVARVSGRQSDVTLSAEFSTADPDEHFSTTGYFVHQAKSDDFSGSCVVKAGIHVGYLGKFILSINLIRSIAEIHASFF